MKTFTIGNSRGVRHCHQLVAEVAQGICGAAFEEFARMDNPRYREWKERNPSLSASALQKKFIKETWGSYVDKARSVLGEMLGSSDQSEAVKDQIMEALLMDNALLQGRSMKQEAMSRAIH